MHRRYHDDVYSETDVLDSAASEYALEWEASDAGRRQSLRQDLIRRLVPFADRLASSA